VEIRAEHRRAENARSKESTRRHLRSDDARRKNRVGKIFAGTRGSAET
jgi:hypothetical protein